MLERGRAGNRKDFTTEKVINMVGRHEAGRPPCWVSGGQLLWARSGNTRDKDHLDFCHCRHLEEWVGCSRTELDKVDKTQCKFKWDYTLILLMYMH